MSAWLLARPTPDVRRTTYLAGIDARGRIETTDQPLLAKRFASSPAALTFATQHGQKFANWRIVRR